MKLTMNLRDKGVGMMNRIVMALLCVLYGSNVAAQEADVLVQEAETPPETTANTPRTPFFKPGGLSINFYGGTYEVADEPQFVGTRNEYSLGLGFSADLKRYSHLGLDFELFYVNRDYETPIDPPLLGTIDNDTGIQTSAFLVGGRAFYPADGPFRAYVSAGIGYFNTKMVVYGNTLGIPGSYEDKDMSVELYYGAGLSYMFGKWGLGLDYRRFNLDGSFEGFNINNADIGGDLLLVGLRFSF
jgi:hypothetical protein